MKAMAEKDILARGQAHRMRAPVKPLLGESKFKRVGDGKTMRRVVTVFTPNDFEWMSRKSRRNH